MITISCNKEGHAIVTVTIQNNVVEYKFWSISYDIRWKEIGKHACNLFQDEMSIIDNNGNILYSKSYPLNTDLPACTSVLKSRSGILIGMYSNDPKPVILRHTIHYKDIDSGDIYTASDEIVIHE